MPRSTGVVLTLSVVIVILAGCGSSATPRSATRSARPTIGTLHHSGSFTYRTLSRREATVLAKTQWGGEVSCEPLETTGEGRRSYPCVVVTPTKKLACTGPYLFVSNLPHSRFPTASDEPAVVV